MARRVPSRRRQAGFTMTELLVAMVMGLLVASAIVGLSREVTNTLNEEVRTAAAQAGLRLAIDRLRGDLQRASYMSSPNVRNDPSVDPANRNYIATLASFPLLQEMAGIRLFRAGVGGAASGGSLTYPAGWTAAGQKGTDEGFGPNFGYSANNGLFPDAIEITGNMTSTEVFAADQPEADPAGCAGQRIPLQLNTAAMFRTIGGAATAANEAILRQVFQPVDGEPVVVRLRNELGQIQFGVTCTTGVYFNPGDGRMYVAVQGAPFNLTSGGLGVGAFQVNPVHTVRWKLASLDPAGPYGTVGAEDGKFNLMRSWVNLRGEEAAIPELVAEYAVDLKFAFTVATAGNQQLQTSYSFERDDNATTGSPGGTPQLIRSVLVRLSTRAAQADREWGMPVARAGYIYRYCTDNNPIATSDCRGHWARVRTATTEVVLMNQARQNW